MVTGEPRLTKYIELQEAEKVKIAVPTRGPMAARLAALFMSKCALEILHNSESSRTSLEIQKASHFPYISVSDL